MKVVLSWLREFVAVPRRRRRGSSTRSPNLGLPVEDVQRTGGVAGVVTARVLRTEAPSRRGQGATGVGRRR